METEKAAQLTLYSYWRSSAAYRVRIALNLKGLPYKTIAVNLVKQGGEHLDEAYREINPQGLVPTLVHKGHVLTQSMAICEYLDERFPRYPLLPADLPGRAQVRSMALQIACEIHPLNNLRVQKYLAGQCADGPGAVTWMTHWMVGGFGVIEQQLSDMDDNNLSCADKHPGLFECFLVPQVYNAERYGVDMSAYPGISRLVRSCRNLSAFWDAAPENQPDAVPA